MEVIQKADSRFECGRGDISVKNLNHERTEIGIWSIQIYQSGVV